VARKARQQRFCSSRCRDLGRKRSRKAFLGGDIGAPANRPKKANAFSGLPEAKSGSSPRIIGPRSIIEVEVFGRRAWRHVITGDGVQTQVCPLAQSERAE
jgi:hypothetical protein